MGGVDNGVNETVQNCVSVVARYIYNCAKRKKSEFVKETRRKIGGMDGRGRGKKMKEMKGKTDR